jgi:nickel-dependent lactate racemase
MTSVAFKGSPQSVLTAEEIAAAIAAGTPAALYAGRRVLVLTPDATRTCPLPLLVRTLQERIAPRCARLDYMVALGTHPPLPEAAILKLYGIDAAARATTFAQSRFMNHRWDLPETLSTLGHLEADEIERFSAGRLRERVAVAINRAIFDYDLILVLGPVFPHEVVGFSGGAKYLFPGIAGGDFLHFFHWLGAVITCAGVIGTADTPVRAVIHRALEMVPVPVHNISLVVTPDNQLCGLAVGDVIAAWSRAAALSAQVHITYRAQPFHTVLGCAPPMYDEIWVAGKVMYKLEQVVADGGRLIIYGPHIGKISRTWGPLIEKVGYHVRDYFLAQMDAFRDIPRGVLAHSTHVRGTGTYRDGIERPRIEVVLATGIPPETCRRINLGYRDPAAIDLDEFRDREDRGILFVAHAGEMLYKVGP